MVNAFVHATAVNGDPMIADYYTFYLLPRIGEEVVVNEDGDEFVLKVKSVGHAAYPKDARPDENNSVQIEAELVSRYAKN